MRTLSARVCVHFVELHHAPVLLSRSASDTHTSLSLSLPVCVFIVSTTQSSWLLHISAGYRGISVSLYEQQNHLHHYCARMLLVVVLVGLSLRRLISAAVEACSRPLSGTQTHLPLSSLLPA